MNTDQVGEAKIGLLHSGALAERWFRLRARIHVGALDVALARGQDPWSSDELMTRATRLGSLRERRKLAAAWTGLVELAGRPDPGFPRVPIRRRLILDHADDLMRVAERLRQAAPVQISAVAELALLLRDGRGPLYVGGRPPGELTRAIQRALTS